MIDIEPEVFNTIKQAVSPTLCLPEYQDYSPTFPIVTVEEIGNSVFSQTSDSEEIENHARVLYEINVFTNLQGGKKNQAKEIMKKADSAMNGMGFARNYCSPTPNIADSTIYRITARYSAVISKEKNIYWR